MDRDSAMRLLAPTLGMAVWTLLALPDRLLRRLFGDPPPEAAGLRPDAWAIARVAALIEGDDDEGEGPLVEESRRRNEFLASIVGRPVSGVSEESSRLEHEGRGLPARLFTPESAPPAGPLLVHFHGGGWVQGSLDSHARACAWLARGAGVRVLSVGYRLAPEHPFPAQAEDALLAWRAVMSDPARFGADPERVAVVGDSAGAQIAAVLCLDLKAAGEPQPAGQILIYPVTECGGTMPSRRIFAEGYYLTADRMDWFERRFAAASEADDPRASPLRAKDLAGLAPAVVSVSIADPLRDEGVAYAERLAVAGVPVTLDRMPLLHAWFNITVSRATRQGHRVLATRVRELLG